MSLKTPALFETVSFGSPLQVMGIREGSQIILKSPIAFLYARYCTLPLMVEFFHSTPYVSCAALHEYANPKGPTRHI